MFSERSNPICFVESGGASTKVAIEDGDTIVLKIEDEAVVIEQVKLIGVKKFRGRIHGFEPSYATKHAGFSVGQIVEFEEKHVVSCAPASA